MVSYPDCPLLPPQPCLTFLTRGQSIGLTVATIIGFVSALAVLTLVAVVIKNVINRSGNTPYGKIKFFRSPLDVYMCSLLASDLLQGIGKVFHIKWLHDGIVQCGSYCTAQGMISSTLVPLTILMVALDIGLIQQIGETGVAQATLAIAVHTFIIIFFRRGANAITISFLIVAAIWLYVILFAAIGAATLTKGDDRYITPVPYWCWIGTRHLGAQLAGEYVWMWISAIISLILYVPLYLCLTGYIEVDRDRWWIIRVPPQSTVSKQTENSENEPNIRNERHKPTKVVFFMLLYPVSYVILVLPDSICRWMEFRNRVIPSAGTFFSTSLFGLSGLVNVALLLYTRSGLLLLNEPIPEPAAPRPWESVSGRSSLSSEDAGLGLRLRTRDLVLPEEAE